ncbi:hypothetical protein MLD38_006770 [Melastoma candidum]|uniref:Uncharacterized protein n=1 Tax=Melastoma candidum TaxID=119954 RepID=A0ACB9RQ67_9MYRT|nr:hypothetical protein MLD38_006770 [Melastoma candidum]
MATISTMPLFLVLISLSPLAALLLLALKTYLGKSIGDPNYPPVKGTIFHQISYFDRLYDHQTEVSRRFSTYRLLAPNQCAYHTTNPLNVEHVLKTNFDGYTKGEYNIDNVVDLLGEGIFAVDGEKWKHQRKLASYEFSTRVLRDYSCQSFRKYAAKLVRVIWDLSAGRTRFNMQDMLMRCTLDSIFKVGFGVELNCLEGSSKEGIAFMKAFDEANALVYWRFVDVFWKLKRLLNIGCEARLKESIKAIDLFVLRLIKIRRQQLATKSDSIEKEDILSRFLMESEMDSRKMNDKYLRDIILNFMIAGKDTTANTLSWFLYMLCVNPSIQERIVREIEHVIGDEQGGTNLEEFTEKMTDGVLDRMHYLHAALSETMRLYPAVPADGRCAEKDDVLPDGYRVKKGDNVYYLTYAMGRMRNLWGEDAEDFKPERWLKDGTFQSESPFKFTAFNAGPRICLGKDFAYRQMKIISMALLRFFRFRLVDGAGPVTYKVMFTLHMDGGLHLQAIPRMKRL